MNVTGTSHLPLHTLRLFQQRARYEDYLSLTANGDFLLMIHEKACDPKTAATWREWARQPNGMFAQAWVSCTGAKPRE